MAFCAKCGTQLNQGVAFCGSCGTPVGAVAAPAAGPAGAPAPAAPAAPPMGTAASGMTSNTSAMLTYIPFVGWIIAIVFAVTEPYKSDKFVRFHAFQSIFFAIACFVISFGLTIVSFALSAMFLSSWSTGFSMLGLLISFFWIVRLAMLAGWLFLMFKAYNNERFVLPVIGPMAAQQAAK